jgi:hypothetical protein
VTLAALNPRTAAQVHRRAAAFAGLAALAVAALALVELDPTALCALPALLLPLLVALRRYPGARVLARLRRSRHGRVRRAPFAVASTARFRRVAPRGGLLLAASLAVRPPPAHPAS